MAITLVGTATNTTYTTRTNTTVTKPTGVTDGDYILVGILTGIALPTSPPDPTLTGFTLLTGFPITASDGAFSVEMRVYGKVASGEGADWTATHSSCSSQGWVIAYRGVDQTTPIDVNPSTNNGTGSTTTALGVTTVTNDALVLFAAHDWADTANNLTAPTGSTPTFTEQLDVAPLSYLADGILSTAGATGNKTQTNNSTGGGAWSATLIALRPAADAAVTITRAFPISDVATNNWTNQSGVTTNLYQSIDEATANDDDYIQSALAETSGNYYETKLAAAVDPLTSSNHAVHYRYRNSPPHGTANVTVSLRQGASTQIATNTHNGIGGAWTAGSFTLSGGETDSITNYNDLRIRVAPTGASGTQTPALVANTTFTAANLTAQASTSVTIDATGAAAIFPGHYMIAWVAVDNSGASGARPGLTVADSRLNTWVVTTGALQDPGAANAGAACYLAYAKVTTAYQASDTITFTWGAGTPSAKAIRVSAFSGLHQTTPVAVAEVAANNGNTAFTITITPSAANQMVVTAGAIEGPSTDTWTNDADTTNGSWTAGTEVSTGSAGTATEMTLQSAFKVVTASGDQTWNSTITNRDWAANAIVFAPDAAGSRIQVSWANLAAPFQVRRDIRTVPTRHWRMR